jgi:drug/metabolite transporter (DMT)-like permease
MPDPGDGSARPGAAASGVALAVLSAGTFGTSGIFAELSVVAAVIAYAADIAAARRLGAKLASFVGIAEVFFAVLYAWLLLDQLPSPMEFAGGALMLAGVILVRVDETKRRAPN